MASIRSRSSESNDPPKLDLNGIGQSVDMLGNSPTAKPPTSVNVLVLDEELPYPPDTGKRIRTWNLTQHLASRHSITFLCYGKPEGQTKIAGLTVETVRPPSHFTGWRLYVRLFLNLFSIYPFSVSKHYTKGFSRRLKAVLKQKRFDLVQCEWTPYAIYAQHLNSLPLIVVMHNVESQIWCRRAQVSKTLAERIFFYLQAKKMQWFERRALRSADGVTAVSTLDAHAALAWGAQQVSIVENGVDLQKFKPMPDPDTHEILFVGSLDWYPNVDAIKFFLLEIFPLLGRSVPDAKLCIVGRRPTSGLVQLLQTKPDVCLIPDVEDVRPYLARAATIVVPLRIGGGTRIKILEAFAMGKAVVSTSIGCEGLEVVDGVHLLVADKPSTFATSITKLLVSKVERERLAQNGLALARRRYSWEDCAKRLENAWFSVCSHNVRASSNPHMEARAHK